MPDRIIRDELLRSHRYRTLSSDTLRLLFVHLILHADSLGNCEATTTALGDAMGRSVDEATGAKWLQELADVDLVRTYVVGDKRYTHIPRFRQRLRYPNGKHPRPPREIECNEIRGLADKVRPQSDHSQTTVRPQSAEVKRSEVKRSEVKKPVSTSHAARGSRLPADWKIPDEWIAWTMEAYPDLSRPRVITMSLEFRDYWTAVPGSRGLKSDWEATWRNNCRRKIDA